MLPEPSAELSPVDISVAGTLGDSGVGTIVGIGVGATVGVGVGTVVGVGVGAIVGVGVGTIVGVGVGAIVGVGVGATVGIAVGSGAGVTWTDASAITVSGVEPVGGVSVAMARDCVSMEAGSSIVTANPTKLHIVTVAETPAKMKRFLKGFFRKTFINASNIKTGMQIRAIKKNKGK